MSLAQNPVTGQMSKSYANINTYVLKGQNVVSAKAFNRKDANTESQKAHRASFRLIAGAYQSLAGFADASFPVRPEKQSAYNVFMAVNLPAAIDNSGEFPVIDYSLLQVAKGTLPTIIVSSATLNAGQIELLFNTNINFPRSSATDVLMFLLKTKEGALYSVKAERGSELTSSINMTIPDLLAANIEFAYIFMTSKDGKKASNSVWVSINEM